MTPQELAQKSPALQFVIAELNELEQRVTDHADAIADLLRSDLSAPKTAQSLKYKLSKFKQDLESQRNLVWRLPNPVEPPHNQKGA